MSEPEAPPATENQPPPVQLNQSDPNNPEPDHVQPHGGCPPQNDLDDQIQPPVEYQSEPIYEVVLDDEEHTYMCPDEISPPAGFQPEKQTPVQPVMNPSVPTNAVPYTIQAYKGYPVQNYPPNTIPQAAGPGPVPPDAGFQQQNQPFPVQTVMNPSDPINPAPHQVQSYTVQMSQPGQHISAYPVGGYVGQVPLTAGLQPPPVQTVMNLSDLSNPAPRQAQPYAAPAVPPAVLHFGIPPGLEYLTQIDQILIHQRIECIKLLSGFETNNQYEIKNSIGQKIYHVIEESDCFVRNIFGPAHGFKMHIKDNMDQEVMQLHRPMRCLQQEIEVQAPPGVIIGYVRQEWSILPKFFILGPNNEELLKIEGPFLPFRCCGDVDFEVKGIIGEQSIGRITKQQSDLLKKFFTDASNFFIQFPLDMDVKMKAVLLGACILIDILFFDKGAHFFLKLIKAS